MWRVLVSLDSAASTTRPAWAWAGELALVWVGCHLAADRLDDALLGGLGRLPIPWPDPEWPVTAATWIALAIELGVCAWAVRARVRPSPPLLSWRDLGRRLTPDAVSTPLFLGVTALAGAWVLAMAAEDALAPWWAAGAGPAGAVAGVVVAARIAVPMAVTVALRPPITAPRTNGLVPALILLPFTALAARHGLPIWGLLPGSP